MSIYSTRGELGVDWAPHQCELLGLRLGDVGYDDALAMAVRGKCAWQIAAALMCSAGVVAKLGGPNASGY